MKLLPLVLLLICVPVQAQPTRYTFISVNLDPDTGDLVGPRFAYRLREVIDQSSRYRTSELETRGNYVISLVTKHAGCGQPGSVFSVALTRRNGIMVHHSVMYVPSSQVQAMAETFWASIEAAIRPEVTVKP